MASFDRSDLQRIFEKLDQNGDGLVSLEELNWLLERIGVHYYSLDELRSLLEKPCLDFNELLLFCESTLSSSSHDDHQEEEEEEEEDEESDLLKAFKVFDLNGDGFISSEELQSVLSRLGLWDETSGKDCTSMIYAYDTNTDGVLDFHEFKNMMCG